MMKNKMKVVLVFVASLFALQVTNVHAANATGRVDKSSASTGISYKWVGAGKSTNYLDYHFYITFSNKTYNAFCLDPGYTFSESASYTCEPIGDATPGGRAVSYLMSHLTGNHIVDQLAARFLAVNYGLNKNVNYTTNHHGSNVAAFWQMRIGASYDPNFGLYGNDAILNSATNLAIAAVQYANSNAGETQTGNLNIVKSSEVDKGSYVEITYAITSSVEKTLNFECESCTIVGNTTWKGTNGTITVRVNQPNCSYKLNVYGEAGTTYICKGPGQNMLISEEDIISSVISGEKSKSLIRSIPGTISAGGNYYEAYCKAEDECDQTTTIEIPTYCDDANDKEITITAPTDVKSCILNSKDEAGNTYQMLDGQISPDNPYCAVYCKEDYHMTMPGAQYTDSGRYFNLKNTVVNATRTCYATNPKGNSKNPQILIEDFIKDVMEKQVAVLNAKNEYDKAKLEKERSLQINPTTTRDCRNNRGDWYSMAGFTFTGYVVDKSVCNTTTGVCNPNKAETIKAGNIEWGTQYHPSQKLNANKDPYCDNGEETRTYNFDSALSVAEANLTNAINDLKQTITHMEECYNWLNDLCLDSEVLFDYNEQYSTNINYEQVSNHVEKDISVTYSQSKTIDDEYNTTVEEADLKDIPYLYCDTTGCSNNNETTLAKKISTLADSYYYVKKVSVGKAEYANTQQFQTNYPSGTIDTVSDPSSLRYNYSYLGTVFPVALKTTRGVYQWTLNFTKLGQYNDSVGCKNGRLDDVAKAIGKGTSAGVEYVCVYVVNCPDCDYECVGEGCLIPDDVKCPECDVYCTNCIFDGEATYEYEATSLNKFNPNNRKYGSNWDEEFNEKAKETIKEIESDGENIYINALYVYRMTAENMKATRDENKKLDTYVEKNLNYHDLNGVKNAYGTSDFLDNGEKKGFFTEIKRNKIWTLWPGTIGNNIGPAWKVGN